MEWSLYSSLYSVNKNWDTMWVYKWATISFKGNSCPQTPKKTLVSSSDGHHMFLSTTCPKTAVNYLALL